MFARPGSVPQPRRNFLKPDGKRAHGEPAASEGHQPRHGTRTEVRTRGAPRATTGVYDASLAARKFLGRLALLDLHQMGTAIHRWHGLVSSGWFEAEAALARAMEDSDRYTEREIWLEEMAGIFRRKPWFKRGEPGTAIGASDASGQYVATATMIALLVRDHLAAPYFQMLYEPFAELIPLDELQRE